MRSFLVVTLVLVCSMDQTDGTFADFMNNLPSEISKAFSTAWSSMQDAIKEPIKIKRFGKGGNSSTTVSSHTIVSNSTPTVSSSTNTTDITPTNPTGSTPTNTIGSTPTNTTDSIPTNTNGSTPTNTTDSTPTNTTGSIPTNTTGSTPTNTTYWPLQTHQKTPIDTKKHFWQYPNKHY